MCSPTLHEVVQRLQRLDYGPLQELEAMAASDPAGAWDLAWRALLEFDWTSDPSVPVALFAVLSRARGREATSSAILGAWARLPEQSRRNVCFVAHDSVMAIELALPLFEAEASGVRERHIIAAGLSRRATSREDAQRVMGLLTKIGSYGDAYHDTRLRDFSARAKEDMERLL